MDVNVSFQETIYGKEHYQANNPNNLFSDILEMNRKTNIDLTDY